MSSKIGGLLKLQLLMDCTPLRHTSTFADYATFLFNRFFSPHYRAGAAEVHLVFDTPSRQQPFNPKCYEHKRRDQRHNNEHLSFFPNTQIPNSWKSYVDCRNCKRSVIEALGLSLGLSYVQSARFKLKADQHLIIAGCLPDGGMPQIISGDGNLPSTEHKYQTSAEEADMRIW